MKLLIILSVIACSYGDKLDRTYLPPESAGTAGGSPGSIAAPGTETDLGVPKGGTFGQPTGSSFGQPSGPSFGQPSGSSFGQPSGPLFGQPSGPSFGQPSGASFSQPSGPSFSQPSSPSFGQTSGPSFGQPSGSSFGQPSRPSISEASDSTFGKEINLAGPQSGSVQPGQSGAGSTSSQYQAGNSADAGIPGFGQAGTGFNKAAAFGGESQDLTSYTGPSQPERASASIDRNAEILRYENNNDGDTFAYSFETSNGIAADEAGVATNGVRAQGGFSYTGDDGQFYSVRYTADENGYVPQGDHLPTPHPIPEEILKSLEENARAAAAGTQEGAYNPNEDSGLDNSASYPGTASNGYQPGQGSVSQYSETYTSLVTARPQDGQEFGSKYNRPATSFGPQGSLGAGTPQYEAPTSSLTGYARPGSSGNQLSGSQYGIPGTSPTTSKPGSQDGQSPASQYTGSFRPDLSSQGTTFSTYNIPTGTINMGQQGSTRPESQRLSSQDRPTLPTQYGAPVSSSSSATSPSFPAQGSSPIFTNNIPSFGSSSGAQSGQPSQTPVSQIGDSAGSSNGFKRPFGSQGFPSQNGAQSQSNPTSQLDTATSSGLSGKKSGYQYNSPSAFSVSTRPGTQKISPVSTSSAPQFGNSAVIPSGSNGLTGLESFTSGIIPGPESSRPYSSQSATSQYNAPVSSSLRPGSQVGSSSATQYQTPTGSPFGSALSGTPLGPKASQIYGSQSPSSQYNTPGISQFSSTRPESQKNPSYVSSSSASQYDTSAGSPFGPTALSGPQGSPSGSTSGLGASPPVSSQSSTSQYKAPGTGTFGPVNTEFQGFPSGQSGFNQRPQFGYSTSSGLSAPTISGTKGQNSQGQDESGYKYSRPQTQFGQQAAKLTASRFRPSDSTGSSKPVNKGTIFGSGLSQGDNYNPLGSAPKGTSNAFPGSSNKDYATGPSLSGSTIDTESQNSPLSGAGQYTSTGLGSRPTGSTFPRRDSAIGTTPQYQSGQTPASQSSMSDSAPYEYNRPKSQESGQAGTLPGFGQSGQIKSGPAGYQPTFGSSGQERPGQVGYQSTFGSLGQKGPGQVGYQPTFGSSAQERPGQTGYQPTFGSSAQERPGQLGYQASFGSLGQKRPGQAGSQQSSGLSKDERPGQYQPGFSSLELKEPGQTGYDFSKQKRPGQTGSQPSFSPSSQDVPSQTGTQPGFGFSGQDRPGQSGTQPSFSSLGQQGPGQKGFSSGSGTSGFKGPGQAGSQSPFTSSGQDRPGLLGKGKPTENFNGPRQPPSFSAEEGYKY